MAGRPAEQSHDVGAWATLTRRLSPYLDLAIGLAAAVMSVASLLTADVASIDSRLEPGDPFAIGAGAVVATSDADLAFIAGESGIATFAAVAVVGAVFLARAKVWRTDTSAVDAPERELTPVA